MRFLADECCDKAVVRGLRASGYDVLSVSDISPRAGDLDVIRLSVHEKRILLTEDKDFGQLVFAHGQKTVGVIFLRFPTSARRQILNEVLRLVKQQGERLAGSFVTVQPGRVRIIRTPVKFR
jgi:predicted nuclease of predicted toxin-antitoxin system